MLKRTLEKSDDLMLNTTEIKAIANEILETAKLATKKAVDQLENPENNHFPKRGNSLEEIIYKRLKSLDEDTQNRAKKRMKEHLIIAKSSRVKSIQPESSEPFFEQLRKIKPSTSISFETIKEEGFEIASELLVERNSLQARKPINALNTRKSAEAKIMAKSGGIPSQTFYRELELRVEKIKCLETTTGLGADEITLDGVAISPTGKVKDLNKLVNNKEFYDNTTKSFNPPKAFAKFNFVDDDILVVDGETYEVGWPRTYMVTFLMAEIDNGGFPVFVKDIIKEIKSKAISEIKAAVAGAIGALGGPVVSVIAAALTWVASKITEWIITNFTALLIELWEDNAFIPITVNLKLEKPGTTSGETEINKSPLWWKQYGGHYKVYFDWKLKNAYTPTPLQSSILTPGVIDWFPLSTSRKKRTEVFMRGLDHKVYRSYFNNEWSNWGLFPTDYATFLSAPTLASWKKGRLELFALGKDNKIYQNSLNNYDWTGWNHGSLNMWNDYLFKFGPTVISRKQNYIDLFAVGMDRRIYNFFWDGSNWSDLRIDLPMKAFISSPSVTSRGANNMDVVALGDDRKIYISSWFPNSIKWSSWSVIGNGTFTSAPSICSWDENRLHLFARGDDRQIYHAYYENGKGWIGWNSKELSTSNATFLSAPMAISKAPGLIDLYAIGDDQSMWRNVFNGVKWSGWFNDFKPGYFE